MSSFLGGGGGGGSSFPPMIDSAIAYPVVASGFTYTVPNNVWHVVLLPAMTINSGTVVLPAAPTDGQIVRCKTSETILTFTVSPNAGQFLDGTPISLSAFTYFEATYRASNTTWYIEFIAGALINLTAPLTLYICLLAGTIVGGSGYVSASYTAVPLTGGTGTGAQADITVAGGIVTAVAPNAQGTGYVIGDVLSASNANLGGAGAGFTFTLTSIGNDGNQGTTLATAFKTFAKAFQEIASFNLAGGFAVTINVSDGRYDELLNFSTLIGSTSGQINWVGNATTRENCHIKPTTQPSSLPVLFVQGVSIGHVMTGFWFDGTDPGFNGWEPVRVHDSAQIQLTKTRVSLPSNDAWNLFTTNGGTIGISDLTCDFPGVQASFAVMFGGQITTNSGFNVTLLSSAPTAGSGPFFEFTSSALFNSFSAWVGWGATQGGKMSLQNGARVLTLNSTDQIPGSNDIGTFKDGNCYYGADFWAPQTGGALSAGGTITSFAVPGVGTGTELPIDTQWGVYKVSVAHTAPFMLAINNGTVPIYFPLGCGINLQTGVSYTLATTDNGLRVEMTNAGANTLTVPTDATANLPIGARVTVTQGGAGATTVAAAGGVTGHNFGVIAAQWDSATLYKRAANEWVMTLD